MKLARVRLVGFRGFRELFDVEIEEGFVIVTGRNGAGKSTICDAIEFGLTGTLSRFDSSKSKEKDETVADYVWWRGEGEPKDRFVELTFRTESGELVPMLRRPETTQTDFTREYAHHFCAPLSDPRPLEETVRTMLLRDETIASFSIDLPETDRFAAVERALGLAAGATRETVVIEAARVIDARVRDARSRYQVVRERVLLLTEELAQRRSEAVSSGVLSAAEATLRADLKVDAPGVDQEAAQRQLATMRALVGEVERAHHHLLEELRHQQEIDRQAAGNAVDEAKNAAVLAEKEIERVEARIREVERVISETATNAKDSGIWAQLVKAGATIGTVEGKCPLCASSISEIEYADQLARIGFCDRGRSLKR